MKVKRFQPRAQGRTTPDFDTPSHVEIALEEQAERREGA
jgi:ribosomal protein L22